jgi:hypothetical protein
LIPAQKKLRLQAFLDVLPGQIDMNYTYYRGGS